MQKTTHPLGESKLNQVLQNLPMKTYTNRSELPADLDLLQANYDGYRDVLGVINVGAARKHFFVIDSDPPKIYFKYKNPAELEELQRLFANKKVWGETRLHSSEKFDYSMNRPLYDSLPPTEGTGYVVATLSPEKKGGLLNRESLLTPKQRLKNALANLVDANLNPEFEFYSVVRDRLSHGEDLPPASRQIKFHKSSAEPAQTPRLGEGRSTEVPSNLHSEPADSVRVDLYHEAKNMFRNVKMAPNTEHALNNTIGGSMTLRLAGENGVKIPVAVDILPNAVELHFFSDGDSRLVDVLTHHFGSLGGRQVNSSAERNMRMFGVPRASYVLSLQIDAYNADLARLSGEASTRFISKERRTADFLSYLQHEFGLEFMTRNVLDDTHMHFIKFPSGHTAGGTESICGAMLLQLTLK